VLYTELKKKYIYVTKTLYSVIWIPWASQTL